MKSVAQTEPLSLEKHVGVIDYQVIHTTSGRFRIKIPRLSQDLEYANQLSWSIESFDFIISVRINPAAESLIIHYQENLVSSTTVQESLLMIIQQAALAETSSEIAQNKTEFKPAIDWMIERVGMPVFSLGLTLIAQQLLPIPPLLLAGVVAVAAIPFIQRTLDLMLTERRLDADILDILWMSFYTIKGDFVGPALMVSLIESGDVLRDATARANEQQMLDLLQGVDKYVRIERNGQEERIQLSEVKKGDRIVVYAGETIPVSGRVLRGTALIDEHKLTGESKLVSRSEGQVVHASTLVLQGKICVLTKRTGKNTRLGLAVQLMQSAPVHDTRVEDYASKIANALIAPTLLLSGVIFALTRDVSRAVAPLHLDFGHAIRIAVPTTALAAVTYAARQGIYIRSGRALEMLARLDTVVFDKTGTLTQGNAAVVAIETAHDRISPQEILALAASAEQGNSHPVASAIIRCAEENGVEIKPSTTKDYRIGLGIVALIEDTKVLVGSELLLQQEGINLDAIHKKYPSLKTSTYSVVYVAKNNQLLGAILFTDPLRSESTKVVKSLQCQGMTTYMLTGDNQRVANHVGTQLGISQDHTYAQVFPDKKVEVICSLKDRGRTVAFVGEGINDAAALAHADVSISFLEGSDIARETADVVLLDNDLQGIAHAIAIAKRAMEIIYQNTAIAAIPNISVVMAGVLFALDPVLGVIISNGSALLAELNSFRPLFEPDTDPNSHIVDESLISTFANSKEVSTSSNTKKKTTIISDLLPI
ncbi:MAG: heavy metal translocating P-type ATPase [Pelatocladus maniniholoensis HA4357-MV3]|jgi:heavy metal translocating P-type ATPase|uniref:Heavy metal translocating P-type ATPase n=1 Tax=Pelatocladus maniniholoensis HA4357-MV3 TaxID=1117104 RepID=A0A9E3H641_9NOST|nr:heavy metal translocating P-type ATPase [Pelatocladus maniniholoensis HA4357-MV3]BAZ70649.1 heavy metal translocating P-type ATPase [Fischerella sp. NIES-4106]